MTFPAMTFPARTACLALAASLLFSGEAFAVSLGLSRDGVLGRPPAVREGEPALAPLAHVRFCMDRPAECQAGEGGDTVTLDPDTREVLDEVNRSVNRRIHPTPKRYLVGQWEIGPARGDCNDFAVTKRHELIARGLPARALLLAVVETSWGEGHLVLVVRSDQGDYVLDNLSPALRRWSSTGHTFLKLQSRHDPRAWVSVPDGGARARPEAFAGQL